MYEKTYEVGFGAKPTCLMKRMRREALQATSGLYVPDRNVFVCIVDPKSMHCSLFVSSLRFEAVCILMAFPQEIWPEEI